MSLFAIIAWAGGVIISFYNGNRKLPLIILLLGLGILFAPIGIWGGGRYRHTRCHHLDSEQGRHDVKMLIIRPPTT